jgi:hypothetical protein
LTISARAANSATPYLHTCTQHTQDTLLDRVIFSRVRRETQRVTYIDIMFIHDYSLKMAIHTDSNIQRNLNATIDRICRHPHRIHSHTLL